MKRLQVLKSALVGGASVVALVQPAAAKEFDIPDGDLSTALVAYMKQSNVELVYADNVVRGHKSRGARGEYTETSALTQILQGTGFTVQSVSSSAIGIVPEQGQSKSVEQLAQVTRRAPSAPAAQAGVETVVVTAQHKSENIQNVPIAVSAFSQEQLKEEQVAGGPDLVKEVPNLTFTKTNFTGYNLQIRGIGTQAISVTTDPAVAVAFNDIPFIRNHFFEQEFYDLADAEVLRGPQGTLYGRNATAGVVNIKSAMPDGDYEAMLSADFGNYNGQRLEGMLNVPIVGDKLDIRMAGEWTKREGYTYDQELNTNVDGRDLWSGRLTIGFNPSENLHSDFVWEHFSEDDDRMRSAKQLCEKDPGPTSIDGLDLLTLANPAGSPRPAGFTSDFARTWLSQGCLPTSLYSPSAYETPNGQTLPFVALGEFIAEVGTANGGGFLNPIDPYANQTQPMNLRTIQSLILPHYRAKNDTLEYNLSYQITPDLTLISATGYNNDFLFSTEDFNRFDTAPGIFGEGLGQDNNGQTPPVLPNGVYCDPQVGCSNAMVAEDLSDERASQFNQEIRLTSDFKGPLNFSVGTNYTHYQTAEDYYVFFNLLTALTQWSNGSGPGQYAICDVGPPYPNFVIPAKPFATPGGKSGVPADYPSVFGCGTNLSFTPYGYVGTYIDPNPIGSLDGLGHNYFRSDNPYALNSWAGFGEVYYDITPDLKLTGGLRWTDDRKVFQDIPSAAFELGGGYTVANIVKQGWDEWTGRFNASWSPQLDFTDQSMFYASYAHGYKGGGANPPGPIVDGTSQQSYSTHPPTFAPEHIEAFELGTKNSALDGSLTFDGDVFFYNYHGYQISQIVDRTSINLNFNATVEGAELESTWEPVPGLKFNLAGGYEDTAVDKNQYAIDLMDRTAGVPGWVVVKPYPSETSNCILPAAVIPKIIALEPYADPFGDGLDGACNAAYGGNQGFTRNPTNDLAAFAEAGFNPATAPNNGEGFAKNLSGNKLPNTPPFTLSTGGQYSMPVSSDWAATLRADFYWQGNTYARIFNDKPYDSIHGYTNLNLSLMLDSQDGWDVMFYIKNVFDVTAITGAFLNSDDTALTTNVFVTDPRLFGVRVTKQLDESDGFWGDAWSGADIFKDVFSDTDGGRPPLWIELGGNFDQLADSTGIYQPSFLSKAPAGFPSQLPLEKPLGLGPDWEAAVSFQPDDSDWSASVSVRYGRTSKNNSRNIQTNVLPTHRPTQYRLGYAFAHRYEETQAQNAEMHAIMDFMVGKDVGLGAVGLSGTGVLSGGVRYAEFTSRSNVAIGLDPDSSDVPKTPRYHYHQFNGAFSASRSFRGIGPSIAMKASTPVTGEPADGQFTFDWGANGAVLFGRQKARGSQTTKGAYYCNNGLYGSLTGCPARTANAGPINTEHPFVLNSHYQHTKSFNRSRMVVVPNIGAFLGVSYKLPNAKLSFGYRADEFFGAMDGGIDTSRSENRGFFGPFAKLSIGIGG